jgi:hypothetical protein
LPLVILFLPATRQRRSSSTLDFIYGLMLSLLIMVVALGAFAVVAVAKVSYAWALVQTLLGMAVLLLALSWLWNPRAGFGGLGQITSRYLLSVGLPFEGWAQRLATLAERGRDPESFVRDALADLHELTWITGGRWQASRGEGDIRGARRTCPHPCLPWLDHDLAIAASAHPRAGAACSAAVAVAGLFLRRQGARANPARTGL